MPFYEYQCLHCSNQFELKRSFCIESEVTCPQCQGEVQRMFSPVAVIYKGSGFYTTDNPKTS